MTSDPTGENRLDVIWAPWRMAYILSDIKPQPEPVPPESFLPGADHDCFLCQAAVCDESSFRDRLILRRSQRILTVLNRFPYNNGHLLVTPRRHIARLDQLTAEEGAELLAEITRMTTLLEKHLNANGFNVGLNLGRCAGAGLPGHLHWHIVPRWNGDTNFITTIGSTKAIPQSMEALVDLLGGKE